VLEAIRNLALIIGGGWFAWWLDRAAYIGWKLGPKRPIDPGSVSVIRKRISRLPRSYVYFENGSIKLDLRGYLQTPEGQAAVRRVMAAAPPWPPGAVIKECPHCWAKYANGAICCSKRGEL